MQSGSRVTFSHFQRNPLPHQISLQFWHTHTRRDTLTKSRWKQKFNSLDPSVSVSGHGLTHTHLQAHEDIKMQALTETYPNMFELDAFS